MSKKADFKKQARLVRMILKGGMHHSTVPKTPMYWTAVDCFVGRDWGFDQSKCLLRSHCLKMIQGGDRVELRRLIGNSI